VYYDKNKQKYFIYKDWKQKFWTKTFWPNITLAMHATNKNGNKKLWNKSSHGCIRIPEQVESVISDKRNKLWYVIIGN
jgi:lipoprotein-anchoring transpeptidase ErfK/SrfK